MRQLSRAGCRLLLSAALCVPAGAAGIDAALLALIPPEAHTLAGVQVAQAEATPIGQALMSQIQLDPDSTRVLAEAGFDLRRDLRELLMAAGASSDPFGGAVLLGRGSFHPEKVASAALAGGAAVSTYRGVKLIESKSSGPEKPGAAGGCLAFLDNTSVVAGQTPAVKSAIDRHAAHSVYAGSLAARAQRIAATADAWVVTLASPSGFAPGNVPPQLGQFGNILRSALQISAGLKLGADQVTLTADVVMRTAQDAQSTADVLKFAIQMIQPSRPGGAEGRPLADVAQISTTGATLHLVAAMPEKQLEQIFLQPPPRPKKLAARQ